MLPKPKKKKWSVSETSLDNLWRKAIRKKFHGRCGLCGEPGTEAHHVVRRAKKVLRWEIRNGVLLCASCHRYADTGQGRRAVEALVDTDYLFASEQYNLKEICHNEAYTPDSFRLEMQKRLKEYLNERQSD
jgi:predicted restriction endonuclease